MRARSSLLHAMKLEKKKKNSVIFKCLSTRLINKLAPLAQKVTAHPKSTPKKNFLKKKPTTIYLFFAYIVQRQKFFEKKEDKRVCIYTIYPHSHLFRKLIEKPAWLPFFAHPMLIRMMATMLNSIVRVRCYRYPYSFVQI